MTEGADAVERELGAFADGVARLTAPLFEVVSSRPMERTGGGPGELPGYLLVLRRRP